MAEVGSEDEDDVPSQLPLSQLSLPSLLDVASAPGGLSQDPVADDLPEELPLSQGIGGEEAPQESHTNLAGAAPLPLDDDASLPAADRDEELPLRTGRLVQSVFGGRGRPNRVLQEAMRRGLANTALQRVAEQPGQTMAPAAPGSVQLRLTSDPGAADRKRQRRELLERTRVDASGRHMVVTQQVEGLRLLPLVAAAVGAASEAAKMTGETVDAEVSTACQVLLGDRPLPMSSKKLRARMLDLIEAKLESVMPLLGSATLLLDRLRRAEFEKALVQQASTEGCVAGLHRL